MRTSICLSWRRLKAAVLLSLALSLVDALAAGAAAADGRWAIVLGISEYADESIPDLDNTLNDSRTIAATLNDMSFDVYYHENATRAELDELIAKLVAEQKGAEVGLFYFAGHGVQSDGANFLLPSDFRPGGDDVLETQGVSIQRVIQDLRGTNAESLVVVLDSCRNAPFAQGTAYGTGLALVDAPENTIIAYATAPGAVALDGAGANSPYTAALASILSGPRQDIRDVLRLVRARVRLATGGMQTPWFLDNSPRDIIIQPREPVTLQSAAAEVESEEISIESTHWQTIANSADPRDFRTFAELHPDHALADVASRQVTLLESGGAPDFPLMDLRAPDPNPEVPGGLSSLITQCDILATGPTDVLALAEPVPHDLVNTRAAMRACVEAVSNDPLNPRLLGLLGRVLRLEERFDEARYYGEQAAELGNATAYGGLTEIYRLGLGVPQDLERAADSARQGAMMGSAVMQLLLGMHYREGWGVPQSFNEARRWMEIAARSGNAAAITALGGLYRRGQGMPPDPARALEYYRQAAALGHTDAMNLVGMAYMRGEGVSEDTDEGIRWLSRASEEGNPYAAFHLGRAFREGWGVETDLSTALAYFRLSAQRNYLGAYTAIGDVLQSDEGGVERDLPQAYANYIIAREAALLRNTRDSADEIELVGEKIADITSRMTPQQIDAGEQLANEWIDQYGLLDFNLVHE